MIPEAALRGVYFDGQSSRDQPAQLTLGGTDALLSLDGPGEDQRWPVSALTVDPPVPGVRRVVKFPDGGRFESAQTADLRAWERAAGRNRALRGVAWLEAHWGSALTAVAVAFGLLGGFIVWGIPALATQAARVTPRTVLAAFDRETLEFLETQKLIGPSGLPAARQAQLQRSFGRVRSWAGGSYPYRLLLRDGEVGGDLELGANAFALPNGTIVMTDQLVRLARSDRELLGVLAHETGHVTRRHGLAAVYQGLGLGLVTTLLTGDLVSSSTFAAAVPAAILKGGYSRAAESESDEDSARFMMEAFGTTRPLQAILARLEADAREKAEDRGLGSWLDVFRSHPVTAQRIASLRALESAARGAP
ncbi:M48 family metallopeptidase [Deinococcus taeanensis]|uniref:M48 family metallopeptidase n=1 Tax=Deinococcus taeanensis TaxID=2737050 RepID=UPI001CDC6BBB|nr:M48 family metallopeptidase [Deinococcus taeanensis]UBV43872.1 M48 family metallopeptidase [Deinococcus taeanensis]